MRPVKVFVGSALSAAALVAAASPAYAFDCIRVSSSYQGIVKSSAHSGNRVVLNFDQLADEQVTDPTAQVTQEQADCAKSAWAASGEPSWFAIGVGVAGAHGAQQSGRMTATSFYELAKNAPPKVLTNGKGIDHFEDVLAGVLGQCGIPL